MATQKLNNGFVVETYPTTPADFDIEKASEGERSRYGLAKVPATSLALVQQMLAIRKGLRYVEPEFKPRERARKRLPHLEPDHGAETSSIWSGVVVFPPEKDKMDGVWGTWKMPQASLPSGAHSDIWYTASTWVGIDGDDGSGDVVQMGCDADVMKKDGSTHHQFNPWWEWFPGGSFWLTSVPVTHGDELNCIVIAIGGHPTIALVQLVNLTQFSFSFFVIHPPHHTKFVGNCAEWIVEALETGPGGKPELAEYTTVKYKNCGAHTLGDKDVKANSGTVIDMINSGGSVISKGKILGATGVEVKYV